ncbi:hypothetical protein COCCADRAFT_96365 [Bipolaris zeicola 26-R-13]|uniref:Uncharacterized protein n=1 Tax=Cochliobolus carbonum (strain 26-R-13) TaxID=930089 RepID=W6Y783_COCC2|nr:uncharacterized protein COCCADRAFT_96365 [Bipolaris zeicola 26-R-13]EUC33305.1 hypothetical protein COCCADRAFT_96365 [Bipolaris zeicola 26-R-13]
MELYGLQLTWPPNVRRSICTRDLLTTYSPETVYFWDDTDRKNQRGSKIRVTVPWNAEKLGQGGVTGLHVSMTVTGKVRSVGARTLARVVQTAKIVYMITVEVYMALLSVNFPSGKGGINQKDLQMCVADTRISPLPRDRQKDWMNQ